MKIEPKSKPVNIRVFSGGKEHDSLQSLLAEFSPDSVLGSLPQILNKKWLERQEGGKAIADQITLRDFSEKTEETYWRLYCLFFGEYVKSKNITSLHQLYITWAKAANYKTNHELLHHAIMGRGWNDRFFLQSYREDKNKKNISTDKWVTIFRKLIDIHQKKPKSKLNSDVYLELGKILIERGEEDEGFKHIICAYEEGNEDAGKFSNQYLVNQYLKVSDGFCNFYEKHCIITNDKNYKGWQEYAKTCRNHRERIIWFTREYILTVLKEQKPYGLIERSINEIYDNRDNKQIFGHEVYSYFEKFEEVHHYFSPEDKLYLNIFRRLIKMESPVFLEIGFFCAIMCKKLRKSDVDPSFVGQYHSVGNAILEIISPFYKPAKYLLSEDEKNELLDIIEFRRLVESSDYSLKNVMHTYIPLMAKLV